MRPAGNDFQRGSLDQLGGKQRRVGDGHDLVVITMQDQRGHIDLREVLREVGLGERLDAVVGGFMTAHHALEPEGITQSLRDLRPCPVGAVEWRA